MNPSKAKIAKSISSRAAILVEFGRAKLVAAVTLSAVMGYILFKGHADWALLLPVLGVFFLGCGCSAINQIQEVRSDAKMARTRNRPLPAGQLDTPTAWFISLVLLFVGIYFLATIEHHTYIILALAIFTIFWYNGVYTYLKTVTALAVIPGALLGAIPPIIGWCAAGGIWWDMHILMVATYFFVWQVPHFWLLMLLRAKEYEQAGLRTMTQIFSPSQFYRIIFIWLFATVALGFYVALFGGAQPLWLLAVLLISIWLMTKSSFLLGVNPQHEKFRPMFFYCILYNVLLMLFLSIDAMLQ